MKKIMKKVKGFIGNDEGQGLVEYALILALISLVAILAMTMFGKKVNNSYSNSATLFP